jgi:hypothetical protein
MSAEEKERQDQKAVFSCEVLSIFSPSKSRLLPFGTLFFVLSIEAAKIA